MDRFLRRSSAEDLAAYPPPEIEATIKEQPIDVENPFDGRAVYTMAINMPNVTSYRGDWVIEFAELSERGETEEEGPDSEDLKKRIAERDPNLNPPYPTVKVDPKYIVDAIREEIEGTAIFYCVIQEDGRMTDLQLVKSLDDRLDASAREALAKWEFEPARKLGVPIAVETLIRIPFRLDPSIRMRY